MTAVRRRPQVSFASGIQEGPENVPTFALHNKGKMPNNANLGDSELSQGPMRDDLYPDLEAIPTVTELPRTNSEPSMRTSQSRPEIEEIQTESKNSDAGIISKCHALKRSWYGRRV
jgi:hypothetical protein